ncbi:hypothetical protein Tco_0673827 [Tanacetum coccineum]
MGFEMKKKEKRRSLADFKKLKVEQIDERYDRKRKKSLPRTRTRNVDSLSTKYPIVDWKTYTLADRPEVTLLPRKRLGITVGARYEVGESSSAPTARLPGGFRADYGFVATMDREIMRDLERDVDYRITDTWDEMLDDEQTERQLMAGRLNMLYRDSRAHAHTGLLMEREAMMSREAWGLLGIILHQELILPRIDQGLGSTSGIQACALRNFDLEVMEFENTQNNALAKLPMLKLGEYEMWEIRIKQYF